MIYIDTRENAFISQFFKEITFRKVQDDFKTFCDNFKWGEQEVILINGEMIYGEAGKPSDFSGILLLKWLRIYKRLTNKIVVFGLIPLKYILSIHPEHIMLMAKGTAYLPIPFSETDINNTVEPLGEIKENLVTIYRPYVKADFNIEQIGHSFANEFGLDQMRLIHERITKKDLKIDIKSHYTAFDFIKAGFLYPGSLSVAKEKMILDMLNKLRAAGKNKQKSKILYIDDQASLGWDKLLCDLVFDTENHKNFKVISNREEFTKDNIIENMSNYKPDCLLLDLRLKGDEEHRLPLEEISGFKLLEIIKKKFPALPVIIISATNKAGNLSALLNAGAEGLWTKPRVESALTTDYYSDSYFNLLQILWRALTKYELAIEKFIVKLDFVKNEALPLSTNDGFFKKTVFIFDTNFFISENQAVFYKNICSFILLYKIMENLKLKNRIIIIQDVLMELFLLSFKNVPQNAKVAEKNKRISAKYSLNLIMEAMNSGSKVIGHEYLTILYLKNSIVEYNTEKINNGTGFLLYKSQKELVGSFDNEEEAESLAGRLKEEAYKTILHADDTLKLLMSYYTTKWLQSKNLENIMLFSDDRKSNYNIYNHLKKNIGKDNITIVNIGLDPSDKQKMIFVHFKYKNDDQNIYIYSNYWLARIIKK